jgi:hypothetical protein
LTDALTSAQYRVTRIASTGGFLRSGTTTMLVGVEDAQVEPAIALIRSTAGASPSEGPRASSLSPSRARAGLDSLVFASNNGAIEPRPTSAAVRAEKSGSDRRLIHQIDCCTSRLKGGIRGGPTIGAQVTHSPCGVIECGMRALLASIFSTRPC